MRWYGERRREDPYQTIWAERKIHRERWTGQRSVKVRCCCWSIGLRVFRV